MKIFAYLEKVIEISSILVFSLMLIVTFLQVVSRYLFTPIGWTEELARYTYIWLVYLGSAAIHYRKEHITLDLVDKYFPKKLKIFFDLIVQSLMIYVSYFIIIYGYRFTMVMGRAIGTALPIRLKYIYVIIPIAFGLMLIFSAVQIFQDIKGTGKEPKPD